MSKGEQSKITNISELGEFALIDRISSAFENNNPETVYGIGDDAAVLQFDNQPIVITSDMLLEGVHFDLSYVPLAHLGYKAVAVNVSDVAAMNAIATQIIVNVAVSSRFSVEAIEEIYRGVKTACQNYSVDLVGGDTTSSKSGLVISITAIGKADSKNLVYRNGAKLNDILCVTGDLGAAYLGLQVLEREKQVFLENPEMQPNLETYDYVVKRQLKPEARLDIIHELKELSVLPTSMIDISDGLASEVLHLCKQSDCGIVVYEEKLPVDMQSFKVAEEFNLNATTCALNGGEDYELLFTVDQKDYDKISTHSDIYAIGYVAKKDLKATLITRSGTQTSISSQGWKHF